MPFAWSKEARFSSALGVPPSGLPWEPLQERLLPGWLAEMYCTAVFGSAAGKVPGQACATGPLRLARPPKRALVTHTIRGISQRNPQKSLKLLLTLRLISNIMLTRK
jgi:hypothetical protein